MSAVAFDLDGCIIDSVPAILPSVRVALEAEGLPSLPDDELTFLIGPPLRAGMAELLVRLGRSPARADALVTAYRADYRRHMLERTLLVPGMDEVVRAAAAGPGACIVTSKPAALAHPLVEHLGLADVVAFVEGPDLREDEPKKETLGRALERLAIGTMVGDRHHDVDAGRAHGLTTIGVLWGIGDEGELRAAGADRVVASPAELRALVT